jgi:hypothetical protein
MSTVITFDKEFKPVILEAFEKKIKGGIIVERDSEAPALTTNGEVVAAKEFAGIKHGSEIFIKNDITSLIEFAKKK